MNREIRKNERPNSTRNYRALKFQFSKETPNLTREEKTRVDDEIRNLKFSNVTRGNRTYEVNHKLYFTMMDGNVAQVVTGSTSPSNCIIFAGKPSKLNDLSIFGCTNEDEVLKM